MTAQGVSVTTRPLAYAPTTANLIRLAADRFNRRNFVVTPDERLTFGAAEAQSRRLAKRLLRAGIAKGARIGLLFPQGPDFIVAVLGVTRIGAIAVPLSTFLRGPELRSAVRHADIDTLIAPSRLLGRDVHDLIETTWPAVVTTPGTRLWLTDAPYLRHVWLCGGAGHPWAVETPRFADLGDDSEITDELVTQIEAEVTPADPMIMIYTSGATAEPKAVVHTHGAQVRHAWTLAQLYGLTDDVRTFTTMPFFWVGGLTVQLLSHLHVGAAVITMERMDAALAVEMIERERATRVVGWTLIERITSDPALADRDLTWLLDLQPASLRHPGLRHNSLGMSETCGPHTAAATDKKDMDLPGELRGSFGPPVPGVEHKIVDPVTGSPVPDGVEGEICVRGYSLMDGLYKKQRSETFDEDGWYHTGDKGYFRQGLLFFTGRLTEMIKTGGANVAPLEVELAMQSLPGVRAAFVVGLPDPDRGQMVGCVICPEPDKRVDPASLIEELRDRLSTYKIPRKIVVVPYDDAPWLPSGKISKPRIVEMLTTGRVDPAATEGDAT
jgi:acyl-CoA synthetase (AMP-forming)/AMP-acid ligase II